MLTPAGEFSEVNETVLQAVHVYATPLAGLYYYRPPDLYMSSICLPGFTLNGIPGRLVGKLHGHGAQQSRCNTLQNDRTVTSNNAACMLGCHFMLVLRMLIMCPRCTHRRTNTQLRSAAHPTRPSYQLVHAQSVTYTESHKDIILHLLHCQ
jgi:hypothetical protein